MVFPGIIEKFGHIRGYINVLTFFVFLVSHEYLVVSGLTLQYTCTLLRINLDFHVH